MNSLKKIPGIKKAAVLLSIIGSCILFVKCVDTNKNKKEATAEQDRYKQFAGSRACAGCHSDIYEKHLHTEHHHTSELPTDQSIAGSFEDGKNVYSFNMLQKVRMEKIDSAFYQVHYSNGSEVKRARFDIVVGSGRKGQSYLYWIGDRLSQMPITYFTPAAQWSNSPGYPPSDIVFYRPITSRCLECHSTYFHKTSENNKEGEDEFDRNQILFGVECEKCHGPGAMHVDFQTKNPSVKEAKFIVNPGKLPRDRMLDLCALCHGGRMTKTKPSFSFQAGDTLSDYFSKPAVDMSAGSIDVHGNQLGLLSFSKCFTLGNVTCTNCHNVHENENNKTEIFSQRCMNCHSEGHAKTCKMTAAIGPAITKNCIDCHMPKQPSHAIAVYLEESTTPTPVLMRTHYIKIYPEETRKVMSQLKKQFAAKK
ncbi:MAG: multiheme c-type cytochrome [Flavisolibacter sp.]|jgi:hypothetical protein